MALKEKVCAVYELLHKVLKLSPNVSFDDPTVVFFDHLKFYDALFSLSRKRTKFAQAYEFKLAFDAKLALVSKVRITVRQHASLIG